MKAKLTMMVAMAAACTVIQLAAMPTEEETKQAEPVVKRMLAQERAALESGKKTRSEVADAAMKLADEADTDAAKLLLMKGAFVLYVKDVNLEKAVETMKALEAAISDMPPQSVTNMIELALLGVSDKVDRARLYKLLGEAKVTGRAETTTEKAKRDLARLYPGWTLASEVPQENRKEHASGFWAHHRGQDNIVRFHPLNKETPVILKRTVKLSDKNPCLFLKVSSFDGKSDFALSVRVNGKVAMPERIVCTSDLEPWEDLVVPLFDWRGDSVEIEIVTRANGWWCEWSHFARIEIAEGNGQETCGLAGVKNGTETVNGYTWSYFVKNGEATVTAAVSPSPKGAITIPATLGGVKVTGLGKNLFDHCKEVTSVTVPEGVTSIGQGAFNFCYGLKSVTIPSSVKTIGDWAFSACFRLQSVTLPESLEYIGNGAFINCRSLKMVNIPAKLAEIGGAAFAYCTGLKQFTVDAGNETFTAKDGSLYSKDMSTLVSVPNVQTIAKIPSSVTKIGGSAFQGRDRLETLTIPESVTIIDRGAFHDCGRLGSMTIPASVTKIGPNAFYNCGGLTEVTMLGERPETPNDIFNKNCSKLKSIHVPANAKSWAGMKEWQGIPLVFDRKGIGRQLQAERAEQQQVTVGGYTWSYRVNKGVATLVAEKDGKYSCAVSPAPTGDVSIPPTLNGVKVTSIGREAFENCPGLKSVTIPEGVKVIDWKAFRNCKELTSVTFPEGLTHIGYSVFVDCHGLKFVTLPSSLKVVGWGAFVRCVGLTSVTIPEGVTSIGNDAFNGCSGLKSVVIPDSVTSIGTRAFIGCRELTSVTIPAKVASIGEGAFGWCSKLKQIKLAAGNQAFTLVDGVLYPKDMSVLLACPGTMTSVTIPAGVTKIGDFAFRGCNGLESMMIPEGVTNIGWGAFEECDGLRSVTIPESVTDIAGSAFKSCRNLTSVTMRCERPDASDDIFQDCGKLKSIHVPANAKSWSGRKEWRGIPLVFDAK